MNNSKIKLIAVLTVTSIMLTCNASSRVVFKGEGLVTGEPGMNSYPEEETGKTALLERAYEIAPPSVPHAISDWLH